MSQPTQPRRRVAVFLGWCALWWGIGGSMMVWMMLEMNRQGYPTLNWPFVAVNWPFWTAIAWLVGRVPIGLVRWRRRRRDYARAEHFQCIKCGYPLKDLPRGGPCPECGEPLGWLP